MQHPENFKIKSVNISNGKFVQKDPSMLAWRRFIYNYFEKQEKGFVVYCCDQEYTTAYGLASHVYCKHR
jgi:hypothetical protein